MEPEEIALEVDEPVRSPRSRIPLSSRDRPFARMTRGTAGLAVQIAEVVCQPPQLPARQPVTNPEANLDAGHHGGAERNTPFAGQLIREGYGHR